MRLGAPKGHGRLNSDFSDFVEYDVEKDPQAYARMLELTEGNRTVPVIVEEGKPIQIGWMGRGCIL